MTSSLAFVLLVEEKKEKEHQFKSVNLGFLIQIISKEISQEFVKEFFD
jgi:hypothetical protein